MPDISKTMQNIPSGSKMMLANKTPPDSKPVKMMLIFSKASLSLKSFPVIIRIKPALFSSPTHPWLKNPGVLSPNGASV